MATSPTGFDRELPANIDAEKTILGAILLDNETFFDDAAVIEAEEFYLGSHRVIYRAMNDILFGLCEDAKHVDIVTLAHELNKRRAIELVGGVSYLASLTEGLPRRPVIDEYVKIVKDKARLRVLMSKCEAIVSRAASQAEGSFSLITDLQGQLAEILGEGVSGAVHIGTLTAAVEESVMKARKITSDRTALEMTFGIPEWDTATKGCFRGEFSVSAAEASGGKTAQAVQMAYENAKEDTPVLFFSLEMKKEQLARRFYALISNDLTSAHMRDPRLMNLEKHVPAMHDVSKILARLPIHIDDTSPLRIDKLKARIRMMRRKWRQEKPDVNRMLVIIDYMQLIKPLPKMMGQEKAENIVFTLRDIPKDEPDVHIFALSQYSQGEKFIKGKRGTRSNDSMFWGSVVNHAAQNIYKIRVEDPEDKPDNALLDAEIRIGKQREGKKTVVKTYFDRDHLRFGTPQQMLGR